MQTSSLANMKHLTKQGNEIQYSKLGISYRNLSRGGGQRGIGGNLIKNYITNYPQRNIS